MKTMFPCPACHHQLQPPPQASRSARLRCPICQHELEAYQLLLGMNRPWLVIEDPGGENVFAPYGDEPKDLHTPSDDAKPIEEAANQEGTEELQLAADGKAADTRSINWEKFQPVSHEEYQRRRRKQDSPIKLLVQVVLGGLVSVPIALLIMWHFLGRDIGGAAPWVASFAPWIVPESMRPLPDSDVAFPPRRVPLPSRDWGNREIDDPSRSDLQPGETTPNAMGDNGNSLNPSGVLSKEEKIRSMQAKVEPNVPILDALEALEKAMEAWMANSSSDIEVKRPLALNYYGAATNLAKTIQTLPVQDPTTQVWEDRVASVMKRIADEPKLLKLAVSGGKHAIQSGLHEGDGLVFQIRVTDADVASAQADYLLDPLAGETPRVRFAASSRLLARSGEWLVMAVMEAPHEGVITARVVQATPISQSAPNLGVPSGEPSSP